MKGETAEINRPWNVNQAVTAHTIHSKKSVSNIICQTQINGWVNNRMSVAVTGSKANPDRRKIDMNV